MRDIQNSETYIELLGLLSVPKSYKLPSVRFIDFLCKQDSASVPDFLKVKPYHDRSSTYSMVRRLVELGVVEKISRVPTPNDFEDWANTRKAKWNSKNRGATRYRFSLGFAMKAIDRKIQKLDRKIQELESLKERLNSVKGEKNE